MKHPNNSDNSSTPQPSSGRAKLLSILVGIEALAVTAGALYFLALMITEVSGNPAGAIVIFVITAIIAAGLWIVASVIWRNKSWGKGIVVTWQILQFAVATSFIQGIKEWQPLGWVLLVCSIATLALVIFNSSKTQN